LARGRGDAEDGRNGDDPRGDKGTRALMADPTEEPRLRGRVRRDDRDLRRRMASDERGKEVRSRGRGAKPATGAPGQRAVGLLCEARAASQASAPTSDDDLHAERGVEQYLLLSMDGRRWGATGQCRPEGRVFELGVSFAAEPW